MPAPGWLRYLKAALTSLVPIAVAAPLVRWFDPANIVMLFLLAVVLTAVRWGRGPAVLSAFLAVAGFDFFFVPPQQSFAVVDIQYLLTFVVMLVVGLVVGQLTSGLKYQARVASHREARAAALYEFSRELSLALETDQVVEIGQRTIARQFRSQVVILVPDDAGRLKVPDGMPAMQTALDPGTAQWALDRREVAGLGDRHAARQPVPVSAAERADACARGRRDPSGAAAAAAHSRAAAAAQDLRGAGRDRARAGALRGRRAGGDIADRVRASAQLPAASGAVA